MSVLNPRNRLVNFRLSEAEFDELKAVCRERGARSISEFARTAVLGALNGMPAGEDAGSERVESLERKVGTLETRVDQLLGLMAMAGGVAAERSVPIASHVAREVPHY